MGRELVSTGFISLDGVADSPSGKVEGHRSGGWVFDTPFVPEAFALKGDEMAETSALVFGRHSYEMFAPVWRDSGVGRAAGVETSTAVTLRHYTRSPFCPLHGLSDHIRH